MSFVAVAIGGAAAIGAGASMLSASKQSEASKYAADKQSDAANYSAYLQNEQYKQTREDQMPWLQAGRGALSQMQDPYFQKNFSASDFQTDPGYQFRLDQGRQALEASAAARGEQFSGNTLQALTQYGQGFASNEYQNAYSRFNNDQTNRFNRLASIAGVGQTAAGAIGQAGQNYANNAGNALMGGANAMAAGRIGAANAYAGAMSGVGNAAIGAGNNWMQYQAYNNAVNRPSPSPGSYSGPSSGGAPSSDSFRYSGSLGEL